MEIPLLQEIVIIFGLSIAVLLICYRLGIPTIVGFLLTGVLSGPAGFGLVKSVENVETLANVGIVLLLFTVGMEFSIKKIIEFKRYFFIGGFLQIALTTLATFAIAQYLERPAGESIFLGFLVSLSSTAIVLRLYDEKRESDSPHGKAVIGILIFQDIIAIPMMLLTPYLAGFQGQFDTSLLILIGKGISILVVVFVCAERLIPRLLYYIAKTRSRELFLLSVLTICFSVAWLASTLGLSLSLGAFLAGLIVSESEYRHEAIGDILPFQDIFTSFFFVSIGMLLDVGFFLENPVLILSLTVGVMVLKDMIVSFVILLLGMPLRTAILAGLGICQVGEFSFVLAKTGFTYGLGTDYHHQLFLSVAFLTMAITPTLITLSPWIANLLSNLPLSPKLKTGLKPAQTQEKNKIKDHVIIIGFGISGRNVAASCKEAKIPYLILEMNPDTVIQEKKKGEPIHFGDATHSSVLNHLDIENAQVVAVLINDPAAAMRIVKIARQLNSKVYIIVRTRYVQEMKVMYTLGADDVIPDEFGSSVEIFTRVLKKYHIPSEDVAKFVAELRIEGYEMLRLLFKEPSTVFDMKLSFSEIGLENCRVRPGCELIGKKLEESGLRNNFNVTVVLIKRNNKSITSIEPKLEILVNDLLVLVGPKEGLASVKKYFNPEPLLAN